MKSESGALVLHGTATERVLSRAQKFTIGGFLALFLLCEIYPIVWLLLSSIKAPDEFTTRPIYALPEGLYWQNFVLAWRAGISTYFLNSVLVTVPSVILTVALGSAAAFGIEILRWRQSTTVLLLFLAGIMIPFQIVILPLFYIFLKLHLLNTLWVLIILYTAFGMPLTVFLMVGYFKALPREILEAAVTDGASIYRVFFSIALPMVKNAIITVGMVQFFFCWNDLLLSYTFVTKTSTRTIQTGLLNFVGQYGERQWGPTFASVSMSVLPTLLIYLLLNRIVIKGLTGGAVKG